MDVGKIFYLFTYSVDQVREFIVPRLISSSPQVLLYSGCVSTTGVRDDGQELVGTLEPLWSIEVDI